MKQCRNILDHITRKMIFTYINDNPGINYQLMKNVLKINDGTFRYHLNILEKNGLIVIKKVDNIRMLYPNRNPKEANELKINQSSYRLLNIIIKNPHIDKKDLFTKSNIDRKTILRSLQLLKVKGLIKAEGNRRGSCYYSLIKMEVD